MLNDRKKEILQAIIEEYIQTADPVSPKAIVEKYQIDCSSATVRNEMAELEKKGYLDKPHTSLIFLLVSSPIVSLSSISWSLTTLLRSNLSLRKTDNTSISLSVNL